MRSIAGGAQLFTLRILTRQGTTPETTRLGWTRSVSPQRPDHAADMCSMHRFPVHARSRLATASSLALISTIILSTAARHRGSQSTRYPPAGATVTMTVFDLLELGSLRPEYLCDMSKTKHKTRAAQCSSSSDVDSSPQGSPAQYYVESESCI